MIETIDTVANCIGCGLILALFAGGGFWMWQARQESQGERPARKRVVRKRWLAACPTRDYGPIEVQYYGYNPAQPYEQPEYGMLGIAEGEVVLVGASNPEHVIRWPLDTIAWINRASMTLHRAMPSGLWQVHSMSAAGEWGNFAHALHTLGNVQLADYSDRGPVQAEQMRQDMLGHWETDTTVTLYLAPDRLLADWRTAALLEHIRAITVIDIPGRSLLLRLEIEEPYQPRRVIGYTLLVVSALVWANDISARTGIEVQRQSGRKKKGA